MDKNIWGKKCRCGNDAFAYFDEHVWNEDNIKKEIVCESCKRKISVSTIEAREFYKNLIYNCFNDAKGNVLELGCGGGLLTAYLSNKKEIKNVVAIDNDMSLEEINYINSLTNVNFYKMDLNNFDESVFNIHFDYIVCKDVLMYLDNIDYTFSKLSKISNNIILLNWYNKNHKNCLNKTTPVDILKIIKKYYDNVKIEYPEFYKWGYLIKG